MKRNEKGRIRVEALKIEHLSKRYKDFALEDVSISLPCGSIMGFIGENGAGKTTTMKAMLGLIGKDGGTIEVFGKPFDGTDKAQKEYIGVVMDSICFSDELNAKDINLIMKNVYRTWDEKKYFNWIKNFRIDEKKKIKEYSRGMTMKLSLAVALSHDTRLLILDEATSGLDPVVREQILDVFLEFIQDEGHSIFISSHILSDLEKVCDYVTFIHKGKIRFSMNKDELLEKYVVLKCSKEELKKIRTSAIISEKENAFGAEALVERSAVPAGLVADHASIEDIMVFFVKEEQ